jgi:hypothetical protein
MQGWADISSLFSFLAQVRAAAECEQSPTPSALLPIQIPLSSASPSLNQLVQGKRTVLALTKADLTPKPELEVS